MVSTGRSGSIAAVNLQQTLTLVVGLVLAGAAVRWAAIEVRRDKALRRFALISGPYAGGTLVVVAAVVILLPAIFYVVLSNELVPKGSPFLFALMLGWISVASVAGIIAGVAIQVRRNAAGWLTLVGDDTLRVETEGTTATVKLAAGGARLFFIDERFVQFVICDDAATLTVWGMISIRGLKDVTEGGRVEARGLMLAGSAEPLRKWLSPYIAKD